MMWLFRVGDVTAMIAIVLYAGPPAVRYAAHGIRNVQPTLIEAGTTTGCTPRQLLTKSRLPLAAPVVLLGMNQTAMLALSMLVVTTLIRMRRGSGLGVAAIAIVADRVIQTAARRLGRTHA
jgi:glycine betaine/proline transport system permease protein